MTQDDPNFEIQNPETLRYVLTVDGHERAIVLPATLKPSAIVTRRLRDDVASLVVIVRNEMTPLPATATEAEHERNAAAAIMTALPTMRLREIVTRLARFEHDPYLGPTVEQIQDGMRAADLYALGLLYVRGSLQDQQRRARARTALIGPLPTPTPRAS